MKSNKRYYIGLVVFLLFVSIGNAQVDWPFEEGSTQASVVGTMGEARGPSGCNGCVERFHKGADLTNGTDYKIYTTNEGTISWYAGINNNWPQGTSYIRVGNVYYYHCKPKESLLRAGNGNTEVTAGTFIGNMIQSGATHVHLQESNTNYLNDNLSPYVDNHAPEIITSRFTEGYKIYKNGVNKQTTNANLIANELNSVVTKAGVDYKVIYSKIDVAADIEDRRVSPNGNSAGGRTSPAGYELTLGNFNPRVLSTIYDYNLEFDQVPDNAAVNAVFHPQSRSPGSVSTHFITSNPNTAPFDRYFNTALQENAIENWGNNNALNAEYNENAEYPDNKYRLYIDAYDVDYNDNPNNRLENRIDIPVIIDNFLPYVKEVTIRSGTFDFVMYNGKWVYLNNTLNFVSGVSNTIASNQPISILVTTSEPMNELKVTLGGLEYIFISSLGDTLFSLDIDNPNFSTGINTIVFNGLDLANNQLLSNPSQMPIKMANGNWPTGTSLGNDTWHKINSQNGNGVFFGADFNTGFCIDRHKDNRGDCLEVCFNDSSSAGDGNITDWVWEFGDFNSSTSTEPSPKFRYATAGTYNVKLTVRNSNNETNSIVKTIVVDDCSTTIEPEIIADRTSGNAQLIVNLSDVSIGEIESRRWNIPSSSGIEYISGNQFSNNIQLNFQYAGSYPINLTLEDEFGETITSNTIVINVTPSSGNELFVDFHTEGLINTGSHISFESDVARGCSGNTYKWTFNDFNGPHYSSLPNTTYVFPVPGVYSVELCVTDNCGNHKCITKSINVKNYVSNVSAKIHSNITYQNYVVEKNQPITFWDYSTPQSDILYGSWFFDYHAGDDPDLFYFYPEPAYGKITHTYTRPGTYKVRLYVGENVAYFGSYDEVTVTVVDKYDYLEIPAIHESSRSIFENKYFRSIQTKNFDGFLLTTTFNSENLGGGTQGSNSIDVYEKKNNPHPFSNLYDPSPTRINLDFFRNKNYKVSGYKDKIAVLSTINKEGNLQVPHDYEILIYKRIGENWRYYELSQRILYDNVSNLNFGINIKAIKLYKNTLLVTESKETDNPNDGVDYTTVSVSVYELDNGSNTFLRKASLTKSQPYIQSGAMGQRDLFGNRLDMNDDTIVIGEGLGGGNFTPKKYVYNKTNMGWIDSVESATLFSRNNTRGFWEEVSILKNTILASNRNFGLYVFQKNGFFWRTTSETAKLKNYQGNIDDNNHAISQTVRESHVISDNENYIIAHGSRIRDFPDERVAVVFYKKGYSWLTTDKEDLRLYPVGPSTNPAETFDGKLDEYENEITQHSFVNSLNKPFSSVIYTYDMTGNSPNGGNPGEGLCFENRNIENQVINGIEPGVQGANINIENTTINSGSRSSYEAFDVLKIKRNTIIKKGAKFKATLIDCN